MNIAFGLNSALSKMGNNFNKYTFDSLKNNPKLLSSIKSNDVVYICVSLWASRLQSCSSDALIIAQILKNTSCKHVLILLEYQNCQITDIDKILFYLPYMFKDRVKDTTEKGFFDNGLGFEIIQIYLDHYGGTLIKEI